jgi:hypothetical protein
MEVDDRWEGETAAVEQTPLVLLGCSHDARIRPHQTSLTVSDVLCRCHYFAANVLLRHGKTALLVRGSK